MELKKPIIKDESLRDEIERLSRDKLRFHLWWLGQSGYLIGWNNFRFLIDPYLSDSLTKKYAGTQRPHVRISQRVIDPEMLTGLTVITSSHNHTDHLDPETLCPILERNPSVQFVIPEANREFVRNRLSVPIHYPQGISDGQSLQCGPIKITGIVAKHNLIERDQKGNSLYLGYVFEFGHWAIYHSGDTLFVDENIDVLQKMKLDLAILPINGNDPDRGVAGNMDPEEAARFAKSIQAKIVVPCHYDMFAFNSADPQDFAAACNKISQAYRILELGGRWDSDDEGALKG